MEVDPGQVYTCQECLFLGAREAFKFRLVWEVKQDVGKLHVSVDDAEVPNVFDSDHELAQDNSGLVLFDPLADLEQDAQIVPIRILLHHIDVLTCLDGLVQSDGVLTLDHAVDPDFLMDAVQVLFADVADLYDLASIDLFCRVHRRPDSLLLCSIDILK